MNRETIPRLRAMFQQCHQRDPNKSCNCQYGSCQAEWEIKNEIEKKQGELDNLIDLLDEITSPPATLRKDWKRPIPPKIGYFLGVYNDGGEWYLHWYSDCLDPDYLEIEDEDTWPFIEKTARVKDWQRIGVMVIVN